MRGIKPLALICVTVFGLSVGHVIDSYGNTNDIHGYAGPVCRTADYGPNQNTPCVFPCEWRGVVYTGCTSETNMRPWCCVKTNVTGKYIYGEWGFCGENCPRDYQETCEKPATVAEVIEFGGWEYKVDNDVTEKNLIIFLKGELRKLAPKLHCLDKIPIYHKKADSLIGIGTVIAFIKKSNIITEEELKELREYEDGRNALMVFLRQTLGVSEGDFKHLNDVEFVYESCRLLRGIEKNPCLTYYTVIQHIGELLSSDDEWKQAEYYRVIDETVSRMGDREDFHLLDRCVEASLFEDTVSEGERHPKIFGKLLKKFIPKAVSAKLDVDVDRDYYDRYDDDYYDNCRRGSYCCERWCRRDRWDYRDRGSRCTSRYCRRNRCRRCDHCDCYNYYDWDDDYDRYYDDRYHDDRYYDDRYHDDRYHDDHYHDDSIDINVIVTNTNGETESIVSSGDHDDKHHDDHDDRYDDRKGEREDDGYDDRKGERDDDRKGERDDDRYDDRY